MGVGERALRRIERGERIPKLETLEAIIVTAGVSETTANKLRELHARTTAVRAGIDVPSRDSHQLKRLEARLVATATYTLRRGDISIGDDQQHLLSAAFNRVLVEVLGSDPKSHSPKK